MSGALTVSVLDRGSWFTPPTTDESFKLSCPGGPTSAEFTWVEGVTRGQRLRVGSRVLVSSARTGRVLWSGMVAPSGTERDGIDLRVTCRGDALQMSERYAVLPYLVRRSGAWVPDSIEPSTPGKSQLEIDADMGGVMRMSFQTGWHNPGDRVRARYVGHEGADMTIGAFGGTMESGWDNVYGNSPWRNILYIAQTGWGNKPIDVWPQRASRRFAVYAGRTAGFPKGQREASLEWRFNGQVGDGTGFLDEKDEKYWSKWWNLHVYGQRLTRFGGDQTIDLSTDIFLDPVDVAEDIIGRCRGFISTDATRTITPVTFSTNSGAWRLEVLDYEQPTRYSDVLDDICAFQGDWFWMVTPMDPMDGLCGLQVSKWPSGQVAYELPGSGLVEWGADSDDALYSRVTVQWRDGQGRTRTHRVTADPLVYPDLDALDGQVRDYPPVELGEATSSDGNAKQIAKVILDQVARLPRGGQVAVGQPLLDLRSGAMTPPEELEPGVMVHVAETDETLRLTDVSVNAEGVATLDLSSPRMTLDRMIAGVTRRRHRV